MKLIVLHDVSGQFTEQADVPLLSIHRYRSLDLWCPRKKKLEYFYWRHDIECISKFNCVKIFISLWFFYQL
jgi:hypothetical protein